MEQNLTKAENNLILRVNKMGGVAKYKHYVSNNVPDRRYRFKDFKNLEKLQKRLDEMQATKLLKP